ncbi:MAG: hypothetical protein NWQ41_03480, partial [Saprospiraceae bacterium]|nr:hypothetical protein [Saprospiraceae bacterium]
MKRILHLLSLVWFTWISSFFHSYAQSVFSQVGFDIDGEAAFDQSGFSVSLSSDGTVVAIGAYDNDDAGTNVGHVRVYAWNGSSWVQRGTDIDGEAAFDQSGFSVSLSSDGGVVAIGAFLNDGAGPSAGHVRVYAWNGSSWVQRGVDIDGEAAFDQSGFSVSLSSDGGVVAIGAPKNDANGSDAGHVRVYTWDGSSWVQRGADIDGEAAGDFSGYSVSLSSDGGIVAIGAVFNVGAAYAGHVRVYAWNGSSWVQRGMDIDGEAAFDQSGLSVSLSSDGGVVAIGADANDGVGSNAGHVRVYAWDGSSWVKRGMDIDGEAAGDLSGNSVSISSDGGVVAIGAYNNNGIGSNAGHVRVYAWDGSSWVKRGMDIDGEAAFDYNGRSVSLSSDGGVVAIGAFYNDGAGSDAGHVRLFNYTDCGGARMVTANLQKDVCGNPTSVTFEFLAGGTNGDLSDIENNQWQLGYETASGIKKLTAVMPLDSFIRTGNSLVRTVSIEDFSINASSAGIADTKTWLGEAVAFYAYQICMDGFPSGANSIGAYGYLPVTTAPFSTGSPGGQMPNTRYLIYAKSSFGAIDSISCSTSSSGRYSGSSTSVVADNVILLDPLLGEIDTLYSVFNDVLADSQTVYVCLTAPMGIPNSENYDLEIYENGPTQLFAGGNSMTHNGDLVRVDSVFTTDGGLTFTDTYSAGAQKC